MTSRTASRLAWAIGIVSIALMIGALALMYIDRGTELPTTDVAVASSWNFANVLNSAVNIAATCFGILLASRRPKNPIGWLFLTAGLTLGISAFGTAYGLHALLVEPGSLPAGRAAAWISNSMGLIPLGILCFLFLLFPTGHLKSSRWRVAAWFVAGVFTIVTGFFVVFATMSWDDPYGPPPPGGSPLWVLLPVSLLAALAVSVAAVIVRFRDSIGEERLQLQWFATGASVFIVLFIPTFASTAPVWLVVQSLAFVFLFTTIAVAVLKYRLYDLDFVISKTVLYGSLAAFFTVVYLAVVIGLGTAVGSTHNPFLTVAAATVIAVAFNPVRERAKRLADRLVYGRRATPYEVLSEFSERMVGSYDLNEILPRMARVLAEGTGGRADIWLRAGHLLRPAATWPIGGEPSPEPAPVDGDELPVFPTASSVSPVRHQGELLGAITLTKPPNDPLRPAEAKLIDDVASQAGLVMFNVRLVEELRASRQRLVKAQDEERRKLERNIHDGAQQQLVALAVKANLAQSLATRDPAATETMLAQLKADATDALENLRDLARGIYPPLLADKGLGTALESQARKSAVPVSLESDGIARYPQEVEAAVYFCCLEALQNVAKYAGASEATIRLTDRTGMLAFEVIDDGAGFDQRTTGYGTGLQGMADRLDALGGHLEVRSAPGRGTTVAGRLPNAQS
ncbi:MAG: sensor histidine kinase [Actinomycetota bacterium]